MREKIWGYSLLILGLVVIVVASLSIYSILRGYAEPVKVIEVPGIALDFSGFLGADLDPSQIEKLRSEGRQLKSEIVHPDVINKPLNLLAHVILMGFMVNVGFKIANLGVQFLRPIKVTLNKESS